MIARLRLSRGLRAPFVFLAVWLFAGPVSAACAPDSVELRGPWGQARYQIELADTPEEQQRGLMFREELARNAGMLFVFPGPREVSFWMRNTLIPLDMIFIGETGVVGHVHENAIPLDETSIPGGDDVMAVLEVNAGQAAQFGIAPGTQVRHPAFGPDAAWPCPAPEAQN